MSYQNYFYYNFSFQPFDSGEKLLFKYFDRFPHNQEKFQAFRNTPVLLLKGTPGFRFAIFPYFQ